MRYIFLLVIIGFTLLVNGQKTGIEDEKYYYNTIFDNPDTNQAKLFLTFNIFNLNVNFQQPENSGFFPALQALYSLPNKKWGAELNYETGISTEGGFKVFKNTILDVGSFYNFKQTTKTAPRAFKVNSYNLFSSTVNVFARIPVKVKTLYGVRGGYNIESTVYEGFSRFDGNTFYAGLTLHRNSRSLIKTMKQGSFIRNHDYSRWSITNLDILYLNSAETSWDTEGFVIPDPNLAPPQLPESYNPFGFRISHQRLYSVSKKEQFEKGTRVSAKAEFGNKPLLGYYLKLTLGWQFVRL